LVAHVALGAYDALGQQLNCFDYPTDGIFRWITFRLNNDQVQELQLFSDVLQQDTLFLYWGAPDAIHQSGDERRLNLHWERDTYSVMASVIKSSWIAQLVTITAKP
jgi:hypothetical protein